MKVHVAFLPCTFYIIFHHIGSGWSFECNNGYFTIGQMDSCHPWLTCNDISHLDVGELIGYGAVKHAYLTSWQNHPLAMVFLNNEDFLEDFLHGLETLKKLGPNKNLVQLIGFCLPAKVFLTEYHPLGTSVNIERIFNNNSDTISQRFKLCIDYVKILANLHSHDLIMCDSSSLAKTLEQYLITSSHSLILNDVDAVARVGLTGTICGQRELTGDFVAPEQRWPFPGLKYNQEEMLPYNEKTDIWKIPPVCNSFLGKSAAAKAFRYHIHAIHRLCREKDPQKRPSASKVLEAYEKLHHTYFIMKEEL